MMTTSPVVPSHRGGAAEAAAALMGGGGGPSGVSGRGRYEETRTRGKRRQYSSPHDVDVVVGVSAASFDETRHGSNSSAS
jgi:hypothetical protein